MNNILEFDVTNTTLSEGTLTNVIGGDWLVIRDSIATFINDNGVLEDAMEIVAPVIVDDPGFDIETGAGETNWRTAGTVTFAGGVAIIDGTAVTSLLIQDLGLVNGKTYRFEFDITDWLYGNSFAATGLIESSGTQIYYIHGNGPHSFTREWDDSGDRGDIYFRSYIGGYFSVDNVVVTEIITKNIPRIQNGKVLIETQNINYVSNNETWERMVKSNIATIVGNIGLDGYTSAAKLVEDTTANANHRLQSNNSNITIVTGEDYILSAVATASEHDFLHITTNNIGVLEIGVTFDLVNGTIATVIEGIASIVDMGNGRYLCSVHNVGITDGSIRVYWYGTPTDNANYYPTWTGDGVSGIYISNLETKKGIVVDSFIRNMIPVDAYNVREADIITITIPTDAVDSETWIDGVSQGKVSVTAGDTFTMLNGTTAIIMTDGITTNRKKVVSNFNAGDTVTPNADLLLQVHDASDDSIIPTASYDQIGSVNIPGIDGGANIVYSLSGSVITLDGVDLGDPLPSSIKIRCKDADGMESPLSDAFSTS